MAIVGEPKTVGAEIVRRFTGSVDRFTLSTPYPIDDDTRATVNLAKGVDLAHVL